MHGIPSTRPRRNSRDVRYEHVCEKLAGVVAKPTVLRTLIWLVEADVVRRVEFNGQEVLVLAAVESNLSDKYVLFAKNYDRN